MSRLPSSDASVSISGDAGSALPPATREPVTYFVAMPVFEDGAGGFISGLAQERSSAQAAESAARHMATTSGGAIAFSRTGIPETGEFEDAVVIRKFGIVPE